MYKVINNSSYPLCFENRLINPNQEVDVYPSAFETKQFNSKEAGVCNITSEYLDHTSDCYGLITCSKKKVEDVTIFTIQNK